ncbi:hypothetical protein KP509_17G044400 [Ceratopteris richardii]|uniref:NAC domain-containing protein n=1 Tax=Ceratopteris richardii TaxID=49495 RepID=A0A8T2SVT6_CERRI|nr:hypothetical protein KP509_17G044400 [Ceratopteris richardii]
MREDLVGNSPSESGECSTSSSLRPADPKSHCICGNLVANGSDLPPGFRFQPTEEELIGFYLLRKATGLSLPVHVIPEIDLHKHDPWELPGLSPLPANSSQWFFFSYADRKYTTGIVPTVLPSLAIGRQLVVQRQWLLSPAVFFTLVYIHHRDIAYLNVTTILV